MKTRNAQRLAITGFILSLVILFGNSGGPLDGLTGAPGDFGDCTICHPGTPSQTGNLQIMGFDGPFVPLQTYPVEIHINKTSGIARTAGFELVVLDGNMPSSPSTGAWTTSDPFVTISTSGDRTYLKHGPSEYQYNETDPGPETIVYDAEWTAPATATNGIYVYGAANIGGFPVGADGDLIVTQVISDLALPVELVDFDVRRRSDGLPELNWSTATESNSGAFEILRSHNRRTFVTIGTVEAAGESQKEQFYSFVDTDPLTGGTSFYKLKMVDLDGQVHYSPIETLEPDPASGLGVTVFPNPLRRGQCIFVEVHAPRDLQDMEVTVRDQSAAIVLRSDESARNRPAGMHLVAMDPGLLSAGMYYVVFASSGEERVVEKVVVLE